ncbi:MAG TPA: type II toxin-antitoxin system HicB family antitoxin [Ktedonobacterales bacterium]|nr:type II toxin-antitoxin system HicB family antitoxin [Ktedonobacterales bacterium]
MTQTYTYTIELEPADPCGYAVSVPALPGVLTFGDTVEQAMAMAREAIALHIEGLRAHGEAIPTEAAPRGKRRVRVPIEVAA